MKHGLKRVLCILLSLGLILPTVGMTALAEVPTSYAFDAKDVSVNKTNTAILNLPEFISFASQNGATADKAKVYKQTNVFGLTDGEAAVEFVAREERKNNTDFKMKNIEFEADGDFYVTMNFYMGDARDADLLVVNGQYSGYNVTSDGSVAATKSNINSRMYMRGNEYIQANQTGNQWAYYGKGNWYRYTLAAKLKNDDSGNYEVTAYLDDSDLTQYYTNSVASKAGSLSKGETDKNVKINEFGFTTNWISGTTDYSGLPQWWLVKDMKLVKGTYDPAKSNADITSSAYTVQSGSFAKAAADPRESFVKGVPANTNVSAFLANITTKDTGASKKVVKIADDSKATTVMEDGAIVTSDMYLLVTTSDGSMKLYDIEAETDASLLPTVSSNEAYPAYVVDSSAKTISIPDTTAAKLKARVTAGEGTTLKVVNSNGYEVDDSESVSADMLLVAVKDNMSEEFTLKIENNTDFYARMGDTAQVTDRTYTNPGTRVEYNGTTWEHEEKSSDTDGDGIIAWQNQGQWPLYAVSYKSGTPGLGALSYDAAGNKVTPEAGAYYSLYHEKIPGTDISAFKAEHSSGSKGWARQVSEENIQGSKTALDKTIVNYKLYLHENSAGTFELTHRYGETAAKVNYGISVGFVNGEIRLGTDAQSTVGFTAGTQIGDNTYEKEKMYDVAIVYETPDGTSENLVVEGIYVDKTKIYPLGEETGVFAKTGITPTGLYQFEFQTLGTAYWGDIQIYMADDYNPNSGVVAEEADLTITSDEVVIDAAKTSIYGWNDLATVADLKNAIDSDMTCEVAVLDITGSSELADTDSLEMGMFFKVTDKNYPENTVYYALKNNTEDTGTQIKIDNGKIYATREILVYSKENPEKDMTLVLAVYENGTKKLVDVKYENAVVEAAGDYDFAVEIEDYDDSKYTYKAFMWDMGKLSPHEDVIEKPAQ